MDYDQLSLCYAAVTERLETIKALCKSRDLDEEQAYATIQVIVNRPVLVPVMAELQKRAS